MIESLRGGRRHQIANQSGIASVPDPVGHLTPHSAARGNGRRRAAGPEPATAESYRARPARLRAIAADPARQRQPRQDLDRGCDRFRHAARYLADPSKGVRQSETRDRGVGGDGGRRLRPLRRRSIALAKILGLADCHMPANVPYVEFAKDIKRLAILSALVQSHRCLYTCQSAPELKDLPDPLHMYASVPPLRRASHSPSIAGAG